MSEPLAHAAPADTVPPWTGAGLLDGLPTAILVVDAALTVRLANAAAEDMAAAGAGFRFGRAGAARTLVPLWRADAAPLARLVGLAAMAGTGRGALCLRNEGGQPAAAALLSPLETRSGRVAGQALVRLRHLAAPPVPSAETLRALFGLTAAEAEVARALAGGASKAEVAARRGLSECTVRTQVRAVLAKTGAANLRDLERLLASLEAV